MIWVRRYTLPIECEDLKENHGQICFRPRIEEAYGGDVIIEHVGPDGVGDELLVPVKRDVVRQVAVRDMLLRS